MGKLLDAGRQLQKEAQEKAVIAERVSIIEKYAAAAEELLQKHYPNNYTKDTVVDLADALLQHDLAVEEAQEKQAAITEFGKQVSQVIWEELKRLDAEKK